METTRKRPLQIFGALAVALIVLTLLLVGFMLLLVTNMPGSTYSGPFQPLTGTERVIRNRLKDHIRILAGEIGERNIWRRGSMELTANYLQKILAGLGYEVSRQSFETMGMTARNLEAEIPGRSKSAEIVLVGAHYDTVINSPGANDNASGVAGLLELARLLAGHHLPRTVRFVFFANEESPFFYTRDMGSQRYAALARRRGEHIVAMLSLETLGFYSEAALSQQYPFPFAYFYPNKGNFLAIVGNLDSRTLVRQATGLFRKTTPFPSEGAAAPAWLTGIGWSDHRSFWNQGYQAIMLTDTAPFRYPYYHSSQDLPDKIEYDHLARVIGGLARVVEGLATRNELKASAAS